MVAGRSREERRSFLGGVELFSGLSASMLDQLAEFSASRSLSAHEVLLDFSSAEAFHSKRAIF